MGQRGGRVPIHSNLHTRLAKFKLSPPPPFILWYKSRTPSIYKHPPAWSPNLPYCVPLYFSVTFGHSRLFGAMIEITPTLEHKIPFDLSDEQPKTHADSVAVAVNTIDLIEQLGASIDFNESDLDKAKNLITGVDKPSTPRTVSVSAEAKAAHTLVKRFDFQAFSDALQARNFITNKLISIADCGDPKLELKALELLGKHSDIGLFTERSEITVHHTSSVTLENSIKERIKRLLNSDVTDVTPLDDLDAQLGPIDSEPEEPLSE